jgi:biotin synthase-like enzyme
MLQKFWGEKEKKWKMKKIWWEEKKSKKNKEEKRKKKKEREKWEGNKIKLRKIIKMLLGSFCFISSQVPWWQIHTQIFQPCAIR